MDIKTEYKEIIECVRDTMNKAIIFLKNVKDEPSAFKNMLNKLIGIASNSGRYRLFFELNRCKESSFYVCKQNTLLSIKDIEDTIKFREEYINSRRIINAEFKGDILPETDRPIRDVDITVNATHNDNWQIKAIISPNQEYADTALYHYVTKESFKMPVIFRLEKHQPEKFKLSIEQMRIRSHTGNRIGKENICEFHVEKGMLTIPRANDTKMVRISVPDLLGNWQTGHELNFPSGIAKVERNTFHKMTSVASVNVVPLEEKKLPDKWHYNTSKTLQHSLPLMRFITAAQSLHISSEEHRYDDRSEFYFEKDIDKFYPLLGNRSAQKLLEKIFNASNRDGFADDISKLAEAVTIANTYSPSWRIRLICMIEALEAWGNSKKFNPLGKNFDKKLESFSKRYAGIDNIEELNDVRNNVMHNGKATPEKLKRNRDKFDSQKDESKYYFFKFRKIFVEIFLHELSWEGEYYAYSCDKNGAVTLTEEKRNI